MWTWKLLEFPLGKGIKISTCMLIDIQEYKNNHVTAQYILKLSEKVKCQLN